MGAALLGVILGLLAGKMALAETTYSEVVIDGHKYRVQVSVAEVAEVPLTNTSTRPHGWRVLVRVTDPQHVPVDETDVIPGANHFYTELACLPRDPKFLAELEIGRAHV